MAVLTRIAEPSLTLRQCDLPRVVGRPMIIRLMLTVMVDAVDEANPHLSMVVGHEDDVKDIFAIGVQLSKLLVHSLQGLAGRQQSLVSIRVIDEWSRWSGMQ